VGGGAEDDDEFGHILIARDIQVYLSFGKLAITQVRDKLVGLARYRQLWRCVLNLTEYNLSLDVKRD